MFPGEMVILMAIAGSGDSGKRLLSRPMDIASDYIRYLYNSLLKRGYITNNGSEGYQLTTKGRQTLFEFLRANKTRVWDTMKTLQQLDIEISQDKLQKEVIKTE